MESSWAPNETASQIYQEKIWLQANMLENIPYGVELTLFVMCSIALLQNMNSSNVKRQLFLLALILVVFGTGTIFMITNSLLTQQAFIEYRNYPGGPSAYMTAMFSDTAGFTNSISWVVSNWILDAFLVWRFLVIYKDINRLWLRIMVGIPCFIVLASVALAIVALYKMNQSTDTSNSSPFVTVNLVLAYYVISTATNIIVTFLIAGRLLVHRHRVLAALGPQHASFYANIATIIIESAVLYSAFAIPFLVTFGLQNPVSNVFLNVVNSTQAISSFLIIFRVATGKAWTEDTGTRIMQGPQSHVYNLKPATSMQFAPNTSTEATESMPVSNKGSGITIMVCDEVVRDKGGQAV